MFIVYLRSQMDVDPPANEIPKSSTNGTNSDTEYAIVNEGKASVLFPGLNK